MAAFLELVLSGIMTGILYSLIAAAIVLIYKATQVASLAHGQILAFGALFFWIFFVGMNLPVWMSLLITFAIAALIGLILERVAMRPLIGQPAFAAFLMTFAIYVVLDGVFQLVLEGGQVKAYSQFLPSAIFSFSDITIPLSSVISFSIAVLLFSLLAAFFRFTKIGLGMRATAEDHQLAQATGISVKRVFSLVWALSAIMCAIAGIAIANLTGIHYVLPSIGLKGLIVALFGGLDSLPGALLAGILLGILENLSAGYLDPLVGGGCKEVAAYAMVLFIFFVRPYGLFGQVRIERI